MSFDNREQWVSKMFQDYGFTPPPGVIEALTATIPTDDQEGIASQEVGAYINAFNQIQEAAANDPLQKLLIDEQNATGAAGTSADQYAKQEQDVLSAAPKLFGSMTSDQIDQYLAPTKTAFDYGLGKVEGDAAQRGITGSSLEATAMANAQGQFQQNVLSQGLSVGMNQQQQMAQAIQNLYNQKIQQQNLLYGLQQGTAGQISQQGYQNAEFMAQLPLLLQGQANQAAAANQDQGTPWGAIASGLGTVAGGIGGAFLGGPMGAMMGASLGGSIGGGIAGSATGGGNAPGMMAASQIPMGLLYGAASKGSNVPGGLNWASQPGANISGFNSTAAGNEVYGPNGLAMLTGG